jgi:formyltetrahydrofolate deformylase
MQTRRFYTLSGSCPDQVGIISRISGFIAQHQGWILESSYHADDGNDGHASRYFMRMQVKGRFAALSSGRVPRTLRATGGRAVDGLEDQRLGRQAARRADGQQAGALPLRPAGTLAVERARHRDPVRDLESRHLQGLRRVARHPFPPRADQRRQQALAAHAEICRIYDEVKGDTMVLARYMQILPPTCAPATRDR